MGALLNLAINCKARVRIGFLGGIQVLLGKYNVKNFKLVICNPLTGVTAVVK